MECSSIVACRNVILRFKNRFEVFKTDSKCDNLFLFPTSSNIFRNGTYSSTYSSYKYTCPQDSIPVDWT